MADVLKNHCAIITGASRGLGFEITKQYLEEGASVMMCARNELLLEKAMLELKCFAGAGQSLLALPADVANPREVAMLVGSALAQLGRVDILVNNAGVAGPIGPTDNVDWNEWMRAIEVNLLGSVLLCRAVLPHFKKLRHGKIIQLSGGGATKPLPMQSAYAASKAAVVRFMETLAEENREYGVDVNAIAPGALNTRILDEFLAADPQVIGHARHQHLLRQKKTGGVPLCRGAELAVFLGSSASDGITGKLISAVWDPWETLPERLCDLRDTDIYALRRILPRDRGKKWGDRE